MTELLRGLAVLAEPPAPMHARLAGLLGLPAPTDPAEHTRLFLFELPPYASIYLGGEGMIGGEARDRIAGFWRAIGVAPPDEPDHLATLLAGCASLRASAEASTGPAAARFHHWRRALFWEHLASWVFAYLPVVEESGPRFYRRWARLLRRALHQEARDLGPPPVPPSHFREVLGHPPTETWAREEVVEVLLAPARSGLVLGRFGLDRVGARLGVTPGFDGARPMLRELLTTRPAEALPVLALEAARQARRQHRAPAALQPVTRHWAERAEATASWLRALPPLTMSANGVAATLVQRGRDS